MATGAASQQLDIEENRESALERMRTAGSVTISTELFEKLYLNPPSEVKGDFAKRIGNPTPIGLVGFVISLTPLSCDLMEWRGSGGFGASDITVYIFFGGILLLVSGFMELLIGNSFIAALFMPFGSFYLALGTLLQPFYGAYREYGAPSVAKAALDAPFDASIGFFFCFFNLLCIWYFICAFRTNILIVFILFAVIIALGLVNALFWYAAQGDATAAHRCQIGAGACLFACCCAGWYLELALLLTTVDFPIALPVGDLSHIIKGASEKRKGPSQKRKGDAGDAGENNA